MWSAAAVVTAAITMVVCAPAGAEDAIYWINSDLVNPTITRAALNGGGAETFIDSSGPLSIPVGITMNPATDMIYWTNPGNDTVYRGVLSSGCCAVAISGPTSNQQGMAIDPEGGHLYWTSAGSNLIVMANLNGQNAIAMDTTGAPIAAPTGLVVDRASNRLYWANTNAGSIGYTDLDGGGNAGQLNTGAAPISQPVGLAIDTQRNRMLWTNFNGSSISYAGLDGTGTDGGAFNVGGAPVSFPTGIAIDRSANRIYWASGGANRIAYANLDNTGNGVVLNTTGVMPSDPFFMAILKRPVAEGTATASPTTSDAGSTLTCTRPEWQNNDLEGSLFNAPAETPTYEWSLNGNVVAGATSSTLTNAQAGSYTCGVTATNQAGSTTSTSSAVTVNPPPTPPTPTPTPTPTPAPNCPTVKATVTAPTGKRGRNHAGSSRRGVRLIANANVTADLNVTATGTYKSAGRTRKVTLVPVNNMQVDTQGRRFALFTPRSVARGQRLKLKITVTPTPATAGCKAQAAATTSQTRTVTKIVTSR